jgi:hypothetical protein
VAIYKTSREKIVLRVHWPLNLAVIERLKSPLSIVESLFSRDVEFGLECWSYSLEYQKDRNRYDIEHLGGDYRIFTEHGMVRTVDCLLAAPGYESGRERVPKAVHKDWGSW